MNTYFLSAIMSTEKIIVLPSNATKSNDQDVIRSFAPSILENAVGLS